VNTATDFHSQFLATIGCRHSLTSRLHINARFAVEVNRHDNESNSKEETQLCWIENWDTAQWSREKSLFGEPRSVITNRIKSDQLCTIRANNPAELKRMGRLETKTHISSHITSGPTAPVLSAADEHTAWTVYGLCGDDQEEMLMDRCIMGALLWS